MIKYWEILVSKCFYHADKIKFLVMRQDLWPVDTFGRLLKVLKTSQKVQKTC